VQGSTDALVPHNKRVDGLYLAYMTSGFFLLSFLAHVAIVIGNYNQALFGRNSDSARAVTYLSGWYYTWIHECRQPLRWFEYSLSASLMGITISVASGVNHVYMIAMIFALLWCTMLFGYYTEVTSPPLSRGEDLKPVEWRVSTKRPETLFSATKYGCLAKAQRLAPHLLGYVPYVTVWTVLMHSFISSTTGADRGPPDFVYVAPPPPAQDVPLRAMSTLPAQCSCVSPGTQL